jgi:hypothetical protein
MRFALIALVALAVTLASAAEAAAWGWRFRRVRFRRARQLVYYRTVDVSQANQPAIARTDTGSPVATPAPHHPTPREVATDPRYRSLSDAEKCALLGPETAHMVYPDDEDIGPYPVCRAWKWDDEDGWGWDWSELNCPWKQCPGCDTD